MTASTTPHSRHVCPHKFAFILDNWIRRLIQNPAKILAGYIQPGATVMDIGCGPGFFTIEMARMVGPEGKVIAIDLQPEMLASTLKKAARKGLSDRIITHQCAADRIGFDQAADFILAYYMVHETPGPAAFLAEVKTMLKKNGRLLIVEPRMHVSKTAFTNMLAEAEKTGLKAEDFPSKKGGYSALLSR